MPKSRKRRKNGKIKKYNPKPLMKRADIEQLIEWRNNMIQKAEAAKLAEGGASGDTTTDETIQDAEIIDDSKTAKA